MGNGHGDGSPARSRGRASHRTGPLHIENGAVKSTVAGGRRMSRRGVSQAPSPRDGSTLTGLAALGLVPLAYGLWALDRWATTAGVAVTFPAKMWFVDPMVWLHDETARGRSEKGEGIG